jgi:exodeoxyribonuclease VII large subunit
VARGDLAHASGALRPRLLATRVERDRARLTHVGLRPSLVTTRIADGERRLEALWRLARSLNPDLVLQRGYARIEADGHVVASAAKAREVGAMTLVFADGRVDVATTDAPPPPPRPKPKPPTNPSLQPRLL